MKTFFGLTIAALGLAIFNFSTVMVEAQSYTNNYGIWAYATTTNGTVTITGYTGSGGAVTIPGTINGLTVTSIGGYAFEDCTSLTKVVIGTNVTSIGYSAFWGCTSLTAITVATDNPAYSSADGVLFDKSQTTLVQYPEARTGSSYTIPYGVANIVYYAFYGCSSLTNVTIGTNVTSVGVGAFADCYSLASVTIPDSVRNIEGFVVPFGGGFSGLGAFSWCESLTSVTIPNSITNIGACAFMGCTSLASVTIGTNVIIIGAGAFQHCTSLTSVTIPHSVIDLASTMVWDEVEFAAFAGCTALTGVYFEGNAPSMDYLAFGGDNNATIYHLPETTGWDGVSAKTGLPVVLWLPQVQTTDATFGVRTNQFGFNINWASGRSIVVEASTNLDNPNWSPVGTNTLLNGSSYFSDPQWIKYPNRFYHIRSP